MSDIDTGPVDTGTVDTGHRRYRRDTAQSIPAPAICWPGSTTGWRY